MSTIWTQDRNLSVTGTVAGVPILAKLPLEHVAPLALMDICLDGVTLNTTQDITIVTDDSGAETNTVTMVQVNASLVVADGMTLTIHYASLEEAG